MIQITDIEKAKIRKNYVLVKIIDDTDKLNIGDVEIKLGKTKDGLDWDAGEHSVRRGYITKLPESVTYDEAGTPWHNPTVPRIGNIVYFGYLEGITCEKVVCDNIIYYVLPYRSLILQLNPNMDTDTTEMLNGFVLAQKLPKTKGSELEIKESFYEDRFEIKVAGVHNTAYKDDNITDDPIITEGSKVITKAKNYPVLEAEYQLRLDGNQYVYFQRKDVMAIL
jgi:hypothetical protein